ncbi:YbaB/EbfC family nucleoid-associated protein [Candidatus Saccharibacteria bacterium]|jgi:DNA-binding protein, ybaB/ebfC family|nr:YbaB/EbfC family nucleoid-associated protein [Candidatus Saccharibacteria bacterium]QCT39795.1 YbaB/EbfC family nucleoid-associated protein [Candidatus Saccharibacteria bacterium oral taxon 955]QHU91230.1 YbaB/EbfC family nucleoid-associated protein [Candidatus Saccharibacteria bacterium oral taxon 955]QJU05796.1 YbaB/EbfC family nucleoid-associated protein [Candidatus Saccharibacteria bacterium oral taxon 955]QJU06622.1 YbaB/EbfC family nucleoid-associated protein [Candidatus Saccharibacter
MALNQMKMLNDLRKAQKDLAKEIVEVEAGDGAVVVQISGELKIKSVKIDPEYVDLDDIHQLEHWIEIAVRDGMTKAQEIAAEKMKPLMGGLGKLGL